MALRQNPNQLVAVRLAKPPSPTRLPVLPFRRPEDKTGWCWVGCTKMVLEGREKKNPSPQKVEDQCQLATRHFTVGTNCCISGCEVGMPLKDFEGFLRRFMPNATRVGKAMDKVDVQGEISGSPIIVAWTNPNHYVVVVDMIGDKVEVIDPEPDGGASGTMSFSQLQRPLYNGNFRDWVDTFNRLWS
jgi:hypothetical protein